ncbi:hypothetical protein DPSP01_003944 [Paraphaeosphaeria sporulosa]|uniref:ABM domain-containing protein n=1 Tax=Paraphaeosphaeria sporulosa TaxID=1460663 RepID=A0A177C8E4_9PLEO|nr:uncharacterized protein CC84DRAFT_1261669 [Paraphaeosphaeria sporulosa]OAG03027.1 hypothetical protein CC84DRAFT_1261669 [Paraphaeosphaeria sporulosa]
MPISELVLGTLRPEVAQEGLSHIRKNQPGIFSTVEGSLSNSVGHVIKHNGKDTFSEYTPILALEWNRVESFHNFYPASAAFQSFIGVFGPYAGGKAQPQLFQPSSGSSFFSDLVAQGAALIFIASAAAGKKEDISATWNTLLQAAKKDDALVGQWQGWGIEGDEGTWAGILSWRNVDTLERSSTDKSVAEAVQKLKALVELDEYLVSFTSTTGTAA